MKKYNIELYSENGLIGEILIKAFSKNHAVRKAIKINKNYYECKYIQIWEFFEKGPVKIFGNGNKYLYGRKNGKKVNVNGQR